jgi:hypothetical protein
MQRHAVFPGGSFRVTFSPAMKKRWPLRFGCLVAAWLACRHAPSHASQAGEFGFSRILHGWTNYSTAFNTTHELSSDGEYATVASFYTPPVDVQPVEYSVIVVWYGAGGQRLNMADFVFQIHLWSSLEAFVRNPRLGDVARLDFSVPTGGSSSSPDTFTRGGRPAYLLRFNLAGASLILSQCHTYLVGVAARATSIQAGELFVPTAPHEGPSDVQAGNIVPFGWLYLINAGGMTIYSGQVASELVVQPLGELPRLDIRRTAVGICLTWPESLACYTLESSDDISSPFNWSAVRDEPVVENGSWRLSVPVVGARRWYRLKKESESVLNRNGVLNLGNRGERW